MSQLAENSFMIKKKIYYRKKSKFTRTSGKTIHYISSYPALI